MIYYCTKCAWSSWHVLTNERGACRIVCANPECLHELPLYVPWEQLKQ